MAVYTARVDAHTNQPRETRTANADSAEPGWLIWQVIDSAFPVGGFAHSGGLEAATQLGFIRSSDDLLTFARTALHQSSKLAAPFMIAVLNEPAHFDELNERYDVLTVNAVANAASRAQGAAMLSAGEAILGTTAIKEARARLRGASGFTHLPHAFALLTSAATIPQRIAIDAFFFQQARSLLSAAVRLSLVGPMESQRLLITLNAERTALIDTAFATSIDDAAQTAPTLDLLQSLHERLYSRLFVS